MSRLPLDGVRVVVTRAEHQAGDLSAAFRQVGARVESLPLLELAPPSDPRPLERAVSELAIYNWLVLTSPNAAEVVLEHAGGALPPQLRVAAVGEKTAGILRELGVEPALVATTSRAEGLAAALAPHVGRGARILLPQAADARPLLAEALRQAGAEVTAVAAYRKRVPEAAPTRARELFAHQPLGWVTFTSGSTARNFVAVLGDLWPARSAELRAASLGPVTSADLRTLGIEPAAEAARPEPQSLVEAVVRAQRAR
ncbi:MAG: uroporphyrinogen-III synthase [Acidobacteriota bacterium]